MGCEMCMVLLEFPFQLTGTSMLNMLLLLLFIFY